MLVDLFNGFGHYSFPNTKKTLNGPTWNANSLVSLYQDRFIAMPHMRGVMTPCICMAVSFLLGGAWFVCVGTLLPAMCYREVSTEEQIDSEAVYSGVYRCSMLFVIRIH